MKTGRLRTFEVDGNRVLAHFENQEIEVTILTPELIHVFVPLKRQEQESRAVEGEKAIPVTFSAKQEARMAVICTEAQMTEARGIATGVQKARERITAAGALRLELGEDLHFCVTDEEGRELLRTWDGERTISNALSERQLQLIEAEGHDVSHMRKENYPVQLVCRLEEEDCFYGLGDKPGFLNKRDYEYENWNTDNPQAHTEQFRALYKSVPFLICKRKELSCGLFFDNSYHSYFDLGKENPDYFFYGADDGNLDFYIIGGGSIASVIRNYTYLTGRTPLPQLWTLGHQQSRWGYDCAEDFLEVARKYREEEIPCDVIHFDIDYMDHFKVFTWDEAAMGAPGAVVKTLGEDGFKVATILDPGVKKEDGYFMYEEGKEQGFFALDVDGEIYVNEVWPGDAVYPDFGRREVCDWWSGHEKFLLDLGVAGIWNDMNEPASFRGQLPADVVFSNEERTTDHAEMHNLYGHCMSKAAFEGLRKYSERRPFVITRACYAGTQKYSTVWTGDNQSLWSHLQMMIPQLCNLGMSGFAFAGTDIGGFGEDATPELMARWVEAACFSPLFRNRSAKSTRRQEPWQFGEKITAIYRKYVTLRYEFLPYIYDLFYQGEQSGLPIMRPLVLHYEDDPNTYNLNTEFLVGENLLVAPVVEPGAVVKMVYLPEGVWYDYWSGKAYEGRQYVCCDAPLDVCPLFIKAGSIIPTYEPVAYVGEKPYDKLFLLTTPGAAEYTHFQDNGEDYAYQRGEYNLYQFIKDEKGSLTVRMEQEGYPRYKEIVVKQVAI